MHWFSEMDLTHDKYLCHLLIYAVETGFIIGQNLDTFFNVFWYCSSITIELQLGNRIIKAYNKGGHKLQDKNCSFFFY